VTYFADRYATPLFIARAMNQTLSCAVRNGSGEAATVSSGTITIRDGGGALIVDAAAVTGGTGATYALSAATVPATLTFNQRWSVEWLLTLSTGDVVRINREAHLVRAVLHPVIDAADLLRRHTDLGTQYNAAARQVFVDEAWDTIQGRMIGDGRYPQTVVSAWSLREAHLALALSYAFRDMSTYTNAGGKYTELMDAYAKDFERQWGRINWLTDTDQDGVPSEETEAAEPVVFLFDTPGRLW
jgi:hypothetical protein